MRTSWKTFFGSGRLAPSACSQALHTENIQHVVQAVSSNSGPLHHVANSNEDVSDKLVHAAATGASLATSNLEASMMTGSQLAQSGPAVGFSTTVVPTQHSEGVGIALAGLVLLGIGKASKSIGLS